MRNTNCKETRRAVEAYVLDEVSDILERCEIVKPLRPIDEAYKVLREEMRYQVDFDDGRDIRGIGYLEQYREAGRRLDFTPANDPYWTWYLAAACGCFAVYYDHMRDLVAEWLDETPEEAARYSNDKVTAMYRHLTAKAFERLHDKDISPRKVDTGYFIQQYEYMNGGHFFDRDTLKFFGQTRRSFTITENHIIKDYDGNDRDVYRVFGVGSIDGFKMSHVHYFDRKTFDEVWPADDAKEA